jgi:hypothetical protein
MPFDGSQYTRILAVEPMPDRGARERIDPLVVCNREECRPAGALRQRLGAPSGRSLTVALHAGQRGEAAQLRQLAGNDAVVLDLFEPDAPFPAAEWLPGTDRLVAGAGYNTFWEAHWLGYAESAAWVPFRRTIDDQALRLETCRDATPRQNGADTLARWIIAGGDP